MRSVSLSRSSRVVAEAASILSGCSSAKLPSLFAAVWLFSSSLAVAEAGTAVAVAWNVHVKSRAWGLNRVDIGYKTLDSYIYDKPVKGHHVSI